MPLCPGLVGSVSPSRLACSYGARPNRRGSAKPDPAESEDESDAKQPEQQRHRERFNWQPGIGWKFRIRNEEDIGSGCGDRSVRPACQVLYRGLIGGLSV